MHLRRRGLVQNTILRYPSLFRQITDWFGFRLFPWRYPRSGDQIRSAEMLLSQAIVVTTSDSVSGSRKTEVLLICWAA